MLRSRNPKWKTPRRAVALATASLVVGQGAYADRVDDFRDTPWYWGLESQRRMAMDEPISNVMHVEGHNGFNTLAGGDFHVLPPAGPNQVLSLADQLEVGARIVELDVHELIALEVDICPLDTGIDIGFKLADLVAENLGVELPDPIAGVTAAPASGESSPAATSFFFGIPGLGDIIDAIGGAFKGWLGDLVNALTETFVLFGSLAAGDFTVLLQEIVDVLEEVELLDLCRPLTGFCFPPTAVDGSPQICGAISSVPDTHGQLFVGHAQSPAIVPVNGTRLYRSAVQEIADWLRAHPDEVIMIDLEDATFQEREGLVDVLLDELVGPGGESLLFTPGLRNTLFGGRWPTRRELVDAGKRVFVFDSRENSFSPYTEYETSSGHVWVGSEWTFRRNDFGGSSSGNWVERKVQLWVPSEDPLERENVEQFFAVTGDGLPNGGAGNDPIRGDDVEEMARRNVNVLKMDFLVGAGVDKLVLMDLPAGAPGERMGRAVWSWRHDDVAPYRLRGDPGDLVVARDYAVQEAGGSRWQSVNLQGFPVETPPEQAADWRYACMSLDRDAAGEPEWRVTTARGPWSLGNEHCRAEFGRYVYAGPVNGRRNQRLADARAAAGAAGEPVWIQVMDEQRDGDWLVNLSPAAIVDVGHGTVAEGTRLVGIEEPPADPDAPPHVPRLGIQRLVAGNAVVLQSLSEDADLYRDAIAHFWEWSYDDPGGQGLPSGGQVTPGASFSPFPDDGETTFSLLVVDGHIPGFDQASANVRVLNVPPEGAVATIVDEEGSRIPDAVPFALVGTEVTVEAGFSDRGIYDTHTASFDWGDGQTTDQSDFSAFSDTVQGEGGSATARHTYSDSGDFVVSLNVLDDDGGLGAAQGALRVATADEAAAFAAERIAELAADPALDPETRGLLLEAVAWLGGHADGTAESGASDLFGGDRANAGFLALSRALRLLSQAASLEPTLASTASFQTAVRLLGLAGKSVAAQALEFAEAGAGSGESRLSEAEALIAAGDALRAAGDQAAASKQYALAYRVIQGL